ncbi:enterobactin transporter EntS [Thermocatellispora tengchongensis]|uniref:enterobactin transporter EntS n=1 Tax=Thermocatellispora tengchongensis TaxID=1073253 RepID=UPI003630B4D9
MFIARTVSVFGIGMLMVAVPVQVYDMTGSTVHVGAVSSAEGFALLAGFLWGGVLADRHDRRRLMLIARAVAGAGFALLTLNAFLPAPSLAAIYVLAAWDGLATGVSVTALLAATPALVGPDKLVAAGALNTLTVRLGSMVSPALGGVTVSAFGVGWNYAAAAVGTLATLGLLTGLPVLRPEAGTAENPLRAIASGLRFVATHRVVGSLMLLGLLWMVAGGIPVLMPAFATLQLGGGPTTVGLLYAAPACGAVLASVTSGWTAGLRSPGKALLAASICGFAILGSLGLAGHPAVAVAIMLAYGFAASVEEILRYGLIQSHTPDAYLGRVNALWSAQETGGHALGSLGAGALGRHLAPGAAIALYGGISAVLALAMALSLPRLRAATIAQAPADTSTDTTAESRAAE